MKYKRNIRYNFDIIIIHNYITLSYMILSYIRKYDNKNTQFKHNYNQYEGQDKECDIL